MMPHQFKKLAHVLYECKYQVVFCPRYWYKILQAEVVQYVTQQIDRLSSQKDRIRSFGSECAKRSHACGSVNSAEGRGVEVHGISEGQTRVATV